MYSQLNQRGKTEVTKVESTLETTTMKYHFVQQDDYVRIKSIFRLMYLTEKMTGNK